MYYYCLILGGNIIGRDHIKIFNNFKLLNVEAEYVKIYNSICIRVLDSEIQKLPLDEEVNERYFPIGIETGFSIYSNTYDEIIDGWDNIKNYKN